MFPIIKPFFGAEELLNLLGSIQNPIKKFENEICKVTGTKYCVMFPYGRSALIAFLESHGIKKSRIICPAYTCIVVPHAITVTGNENVFVDANEETFNPNVSEIIKKINNKKAVITVGIFGNPIDITEIEKAREKSEFYIIDDGCLSLGAEINQRKVGSFGDATIFSFNRSKLITTMEGGCLVTNNKEVYDKVKRYYENTYIEPPIKYKIKKLVLFLSYYALYNKAIYSVYRKGIIVLNKLLDRKLEKRSESWDFIKPEMPYDFQYRYTSMQARIGIAQIKKLQKIISKRKIIAKTYDEHINHHLIRKPVLLEESVHSHYTIRVPSAYRDIFRKKLFEQGIYTGTAFDYSCPHTEYYNRNGEYSDKLKKSKKISEEIINLPIFPDLQDSDVVKISKVINEVAEEIKEIKNPMSLKDFWDYRVKKYGKLSSSYTEKALHDYDNKLRWSAINAVDIKPNSEILDVGCNWGAWSFKLAALGHKVVGVDISPDAIKIAKDISIDKNLDTRFYVMSGEEINFRAKSFDMIMSVTVMQHIMDDKLFLKTIENYYRALKDEGLVVIIESAPNKNKKQKLPYKRERTFKEQVRLFEKKGFVLVDSRGVDFLGYYWFLGVERFFPLPQRIKNAIQEAGLFLLYPLDIILGKFRAFTKFADLKLMVFRKDSEHGFPQCGENEKSK